jgi:hypothetical protein
MNDFQALTKWLDECEKTGVDDHTIKQASAVALLQIARFLQLILEQLPWAGRAGR